jgi:hypothetical protein
MHGNSYPLRCDIGTTLVPTCAATAETVDCQTTGSNPCPRTLASICHLFLEVTSDHNKVSNDNCDASSYLCALQVMATTLRPRSRSSTLWWLVQPAQQTALHLIQREVAESTPAHTSGDNVPHGGGEHSLCRLLMFAQVDGPASITTGTAAAVAVASAHSVRDLRFARSVYALRNGLLGAWLLINRHQRPLRN